MGCSFGRYPIFRVQEPYSHPCSSPGVRGAKPGQAGVHHRSIPQQLLTAAAAASKRGGGDAGSGGGLVKGAMGLTLGGKTITPGLSTVQIVQTANQVRGKEWKAEGKGKRTDEG